MINKLRLIILKKIKRKQLKKKENGDDDVIFFRELYKVKRANLSTSPLTY